MPGKAKKSVPPELGRKSAYVMRNRAALLHSTQEVLAVKGQAATIEDIAEHAQIAVSTVYKHFEDKDALISATMMFGFYEWLASVQASVEHSTDPLEKLVLPMRAFVRVKWTHPHHAQNMVNFSDLVARFVPILSETLIEHIKELIKAKLLTCEDPDVAARNIQAVLFSTANYQTINSDAKIADGDASVRVALKMLGISDVKARKLTESKFPKIS